MRFLLPLLFSPKTFQVLFEAEELMSPLSHCLLFCLVQVFSLLQLPSARGMSVVSPPENEGGKNFERARIANRNVS